jgi:HlyD family secretion protein
MFVNKLKTVALLVLLVGALIAGGFATGHALDASAPPQADRAAADKGENAKQKEQPAPAAVRVIKPQAGGLARTSDVRCTVQAFEQEQLYPAVSGTLKSLDVDVGDVVKKGQLLGVIDAPLLVIAEKEAAVGVRLAKGQVQQEQAKLATLKADVEVAKSVVVQRKLDVDLAKDAATSEPDPKAKQAALHKRATATAALDNAKAEVTVKQSKVAQGEAALVITKAKVELADLALEKARHAASLARVTAAFDGVVTERNVSAGRRLQAGEGSGRLSMLTVQRTDKVRVVADVAENEVALTQAGVGADVAIDAYPNDVVKDRTVSRVGFVLNPKTGTMRVEIDVANPKNQFRPGMTGTATLHLRKATPGAVRLPIASLAPRSGKGEPAVYVVRDGKARRTPVKLGNRSNKEVEITSGLKATDVVVADPKGFTEEVVPVEAKQKDGSK